MKVSFNSVSEFVEELHKSRPNVDGIVRVTQSYRSSPNMPGMHDVSVLATYLRNSGPLVLIVSLEHYCGQHFSMQEEKSPAVNKAEAIIQEIIGKARLLELESRAGVYVLEK